MKSLLRNLMFVARRYRLSVVLNLLGLTAAFMVFVALLMQIDYDRSYNAALADADRIAMPCNIPPKDSDFEKFSAMSFPIMELIGGQPHVESYTYILGDCYEETFYINEHFCSGTFMMCAPNFADFYKLDIVVGDKKCLDANQVMIPESFAKKYFGDASPLGKSINKAKTWIVGAVYRDIRSKNTWLRNPVLRVIDKSWFGDNLTNPNMNSFTMFIKADKAENFPAIQASANKQFEEICKGNEWFGNSRKEFVLIPLTETHYNSDFILVGEQINSAVNSLADSADCRHQFRQLLQRADPDARAQHKHAKDSRSHTIVAAPVSDSRGCRNRFYGIHNCRRWVVAAVAHGDEPTDRGWHKSFRQPARAWSFCRDGDCGRCSCRAGSRLADHVVCPCRGA